MPFTYKYPRPAVTCDVVAFTLRADHLAVLLVKRKHEPFRNKWALPGGFVDPNESLEKAAARELAEETGVAGARLQQFGAFGDPGRDPRGHTVTIAFATFLPTDATVTAGDDAAEAAWHPFKTLDLSEDAATPPKRGARKSSPPSSKVALAFDHAKIVRQAYARLWRSLDDPSRDLAFDPMPARFTLSQLQRIYEVVAGRDFSARSFRRQLHEHGLVVHASATPSKNSSSQLYRWNQPRSLKV